MILLNRVHPWQGVSEPLLALTLVYHFAQEKKKTHTQSLQDIINTRRKFVFASQHLLFICFFPLRRLESDLPEVKDIYLFPTGFAVLNPSELILIICFSSSSADVQICPMPISQARQKSPVSANVICTLTHSHTSCARRFVTRLGPTWGLLCGGGGYTGNAMWPCMTRHVSEAGGGLDLWPQAPKLGRWKKGG